MYALLLFGMYKIDGLIRLHIIIHLYVTLGICDLYFSNNTSKTGGAIFVELGVNNTPIESCKFLYNTASDSGAIYIRGNATMSNSEFSNNMATLEVITPIFSLCWLGLEEISLSLSFLSLVSSLLQCDLCIVHLCIH